MITRAIALLTVLWTALSLAHAAPATETIRRLPGSNSSAGTTPRSSLSHLEKYYRELALSKDAINATERQAHVRRAGVLYEAYAKSLGTDAGIQSFIMALGIDRMGALQLLTVEPDVLDPLLCLSRQKNSSTSAPQRAKDGDCVSFDGAQTVPLVASHYSGKAELEPGPATLVLVNLVAGTTEDQCKRTEMLKSLAGHLLLNTLPDAVARAAYDEASRHGGMRKTETAEQAALRHLKEVATCRSCVLKWCKAAQSTIGKATTMQVLEYRMSKLHPPPKGVLDEAGSFSLPK